MHYRDSNKTSTFPAVTLKTRDREGLGGREDARGMDEREVRGMGGRRERTGREKGRARGREKQRKGGREGWTHTERTGTEKGRARGKERLTDTKREREREGRDRASLIPSKHGWADGVTSAYVLPFSTAKFLTSR